VSFKKLWFYKKGLICQVYCIHYNLVHPNTLVTNNNQFLDSHPVFDLFVGHFCLSLSSSTDFLFMIPLQHPVQTFKETVVNLFLVFMDSVTKTYITGPVNTSCSESSSPPSEQDPDKYSMTWDERIQGQRMYHLVGTLLEDLDKNPPMHSIRGITRISSGVEQCMSMAWLDATQTTRLNALFAFKDCVKASGQNDSREGSCN